MSLRIEQNWKWSNKTFPHTLCVVSTSDETTHCGICLTCTWPELGIRGATEGGGGSLNQKLHFVGQFSPWKLEFCWVNISESRLTVKNLFTWSIAKYHRSIKMLSIFLLIFPHLQCISTNKVSFTTDNLPNYWNCLWWAETYFSLACMKMVLC